MELRGLKEHRHRLYREGLEDGTLMALDLIAGVNSGVLDDVTFARLRYDGPLDERFREWLDAARQRAITERERRGD